MKKNLLKIMIIIQITFFSTHILAENKIKIDIISDVVCPWCAIGYKRLNQAITELDIKDKVAISWHPFELNPTMPREGKNANKYLMNKLGLDKEALIRKRNSVTKIGKNSGFEFDYFQEMRKVNTLNAHILLAYAKDFNKQTQLKVRLQEAYFSERKDISNRDILFKELQSVGLNAKEALSRLDNKEAIQAVKEEEKLWRERGVYAVPTMIFDYRIVRPGANSVAVYKELLTQLLNKK